MKPKQQITYLITHDSETDSKVIDYLVNRLNHVVINDFSVDINYGLSCDKKLIGKVSDIVNTHTLEAKKRLITSVDNVILNYNSEDDYIKDSAYGLTLLKYAKAHGKKIILINDLQYKWKGMNFHMNSYLFTQGNDIEHTNKVLSLLKTFYGKDCVANMGLGFDMTIDGNAISRYSKAFIDFMILTTDELILEFDSIKDCKSYYNNQYVNRFINEMKKHHKPIILLKDILE